MKRRKGTDGSEAYGAESSAEATEDFMRRIGWLRPDADMATGSEAAGDTRGDPRVGANQQQVSAQGFGGAVMPAADPRARREDPESVAGAGAAAMPCRRSQPAACGRIP